MYLVPVSFCLFTNAQMAYRRRSARKTRRPLRRGGRGIRGVATSLRSSRPRRVGPMASQGPRLAGRKRQRGPRSWTERLFGKRRRAVGDPGGYTQWSFSKGSKTLGRLTQRKINRATTDVLDLMWKRVGRLDIGGQMWAGHFKNSAATPDEVYRPIYLVDLTSGIAGGTVHSPVVQVWRRLGVTGEVVFAAVEGTDANAALTAGWQRAVNPGPTTTNPGLSDQSILKWSEIRADIWGAKEYPCEWTFTLCQLHPDVLPVGVSTTTTDRVAVDFWDQLSSKLIFSPTNRGVANGPRKNHLRVLDRKTYVLNPTSTTESDADPHVRSLRFFYRMNRRCSFTWRNSVPTALIQDLDPADTVRFDPNISSDQHATVEPKARVFMMITCKNWRAPIEAAALSTANTGSLNLSVYNRWIQ